MIRSTNILPSNLLSVTNPYTLNPMVVILTGPETQSKPPFSWKARTYKIHRITGGKLSFQDHFKTVFFKFKTGKALRKNESMIHDKPITNVAI